jgi:hypothetical protein
MRHLTRPILDYAPPPPPRPTALLRWGASEWGMAVITFGPIVVALLVFLYLAWEVWEGRNC